MHHVLENFRKVEEHHKREGRSKPDMIAWKDVNQQYPVPKRWGHVPGTRVGDTFAGRGEVAVVGLHTMMMQGIDFDNASKEEGGGAYAIVLAGGYKDDDDGGLEILYTGQGGQSGKQQVRDQELEKGNLALARSKEGAARWAQVQLG